MPDRAEPTRRQQPAEAVDPPGSGRGPRSSPRQLALPPLAALVDREPRWAHPFERDFAALLDSYRIRWSYEPTTFLLSRRPDGTLEECFTPDFYLPDLRTYVELTSMRQALVTRKHRKLRRFRDVSSGTRVVMLYRRDYHRILSSWQAITLDRESGASNGTCLAAGRLLYSGDVLDQRLDQVSLQVAERYAALGEAPVLIGLGSGGHQVATDLADRLTGGPRPACVDGMAVERDAGQARVVRRTGVPLTGRTVTLVPALISTGLTVEFAAGWLRRRGTAAVDVCALLDRASARVVPVPLRYESLPAPVEHLVGYGLDLRQQYRDLPGIAVFDAPYAGPVTGFAVRSGRPAAPGDLDPETL